MTDHLSYLKALIDNQQTLIQEFEVSYIKLGSEKKQNKSNVDVLKNYERYRQEAWKLIRKNHVKLQKLSSLPEVYFDSFNALIKTNDDFKNRLMAYASEHSLILEVNNDDDFDSQDDDDEKEIHELKPSTSDKVSKYTSNNDDDPSSIDKKRKTVSQPDNYSEHDPSNKTATSKQQAYVPENSENSQRNQDASEKFRNFKQPQKHAQSSIHGSASESSLNESDVPENNGNNKKQQNNHLHDDSNISYGLSNQHIPTDIGTFHQNNGRDADIGDAMNAIVQLVSKQFQLMQNQQENNVNAMQQQFQALQNQIESNNAEHNSLKPQKLEIPSFGGDILEYKAFKDIFHQAIAKLKWSKLEKLLLLMSKLTDRALDRVKHLPIEDQNYELIWSILDKEYLVTRVLLQQNILKLVQIQPVEYNDAPAMRQFYSTLNSVATNLKELTDVQPEDWLFEIGYLQVDQHYKRRFENYISAKNLKANVETFTDFMMSECNRLELSNNKY